MPPPCSSTTARRCRRSPTGCTKLKEDEATCAADAIKAGYAHFDGAAFYDNEREAGRSLTEECWYTTKVWTTDSTFEDAVASVKDLERK